MAKYQIDGMRTSGDGFDISLRCPSCMHIGTFFAYNGVKDFIFAQAPEENPQASLVQRRAGIRLCPNQECNAVIFVVTENQKLKESFPPETIDFDASKLPTKIIAVLEEAITAFTAGCYRASALMVRRLLEEICDDKQVPGKDLNARLKTLGAGSLIPDELLEAAHELRLLGNDAAHIISKNYDNIGKDEIEVSIDLAKEILKSVYQYSSLVDKLRKLKTPKN